MEYEQAMEYLNSKGLFSVKLGLERIKSLCWQMGNPQDTYKTIHVAGTNGKGSVVAFIASALRAAGYRVGSYTSPHLVDFCERIQVEGKIPKKSVARLIGKLKAMVDEHTYFEITTAMAFEYFREMQVDYAVIEVGLGGRLDATNIIRPEVSVITGISLEHTEHLGATIEDITLEKVGIIKKNVPVVSLENPLIAGIAKETGSAMLVPDDSPVDISMRGSFQIQNARLARKALEALGIERSAIRAGLKNARWPGRMEIVRKNLMFDCAHNPSAARVLARELAGKSPTIILGIMKDKDIEGICRELQRTCAEFIITRPEIKRAANPGDIQRFLPGALIISKISEALEYAEDKSFTVLTGSIFTVGEGYRSLGLEPFDTQIHKRRVD